ncbi:MAG: hypothetical protein U0821_02045 [Chloroflexota bacterium]
MAAPRDDVELTFALGELEALYRRRERARYLWRSGQEVFTGLAEVYARHPVLVSEAGFVQLFDLPVAPTEKTALVDLVTGWFVESRLVERLDTLAMQEAMVQVSWLLETASPWEAGRAGWSQRDQARRHLIDEALRSTLGPLDELRLELWDARRAVLGELSVLAGVLEAPVVSGPAFDVAECAATLLGSTADLYQQSLRDQLVHHGLDGADVWETDLQWVLRGAELDRLVPTDQMVPSVHRTLDALGIRLRDQDNLSLDQDLRARKVDQSFCAPLGVPEQIVMCWTRVGGRADLETLLTLVGEAERYALVDPTIGFVQRCLGDGAVRAGYGQMLRSLASNPIWLAEQIDLDFSADVVRLSSFQRLLELRWLAAQVRYLADLEQAADRDDALRFREQYEADLSEALGVRVFPDGWLRDLDAAAAREALVGRILDAQLRVFLAGEFDAEWFRSPRAGRFLVDLWRQGQRFTASELALALGFDGIDPTALLDELRLGLAR